MKLSAPYLWSIAGIGTALTLVVALTFFGGSQHDPTPTLGETVDVFDGSARRLTAQERRWMKGETWHRGCPVKMRSLRLLTADYWDFLGVETAGRIVVHRKVSDEILDVLEAIFDAAFPIEHLDTTELYPPAERPEDLANVTASFNCRVIAGTDTLSQHSYGLAIDINPVQNPYVDGKTVIPTAGKPYRNRDQDEIGMIHRGSEVVSAFTDIGWGWGGKWRTKKDYMHFSQTGG